MSAFDRVQRRFVCQGINVVQAYDDLPAGKYPVLQNARSYLQGEITGRNGLTAVANVGAAINAIQEFDDSSPFAGSPKLVALGAGTGLQIGPPTGPFAPIDAGYSGDPLSMVSATPLTSPQPWLYVADSNQYRKTDANGHVFDVGIAPPVAAPDVRNQLAALGVNIIAQFAAFGGPLWVSVGAQAGPLGAPVVRTGTTISQIIYDAIGGTGPGYASIVPTSFAGIAEGELLFFVQATFETAPVTQVTIAVATTTIAGIMYDAGNTGLCTIQPAASLGVGVLDAPSMADYAARANAMGTGNFAVPRGTVGTPPAPTVPLTRIRQVDFPVNCLVSLGNAETVRILSVALGPDGIQSFRCLTNSTHAVGESIVGLAAFRCFLAATYTAGAAISDIAYTNVITPPPQVGTATQVATAGIRTGAGNPPLNLALINGRATLPDDDLHLAIRFDHCPPVQTVRVYFSLEPTAGTAPSLADFTQNYYFFEWRATDIAAALQDQNTDTVATVQSVQPTVVGNSQLNNQIAHRNLSLVNQPGAGLDTTQSAVIAAGNLQWLELRCKIRDLQRIGTDPSKTLANITASEVLVSIAGPTVVTVAYDALWISGGFGPDVQAAGTPIVYRARYRSSLTGAVSNPSPPTLGGVIPRRQRVSPKIAASADPQVDLIDWWRLGGTLTKWEYVGTAPNSAAPFNDDYPDAQISGGDPLSFTEFQPWPTQDDPRRGTCNVVGNAIQWVSGDQFDTGWAPGSTIIVNNKPYTLYAQPSSATKLFINENAGIGTGVPFTLPGPTLLAQPLASVWCGQIGGATFIFGCRDPINPGQVHWTTGNNTEATTEKNVLDVTPATEPLQNGYVYDGTPYVASTEQVYVLEPDSGKTNFRPLVTPCGRGFWAPWAFALAPEGCYFLAKDGIYLTAGGGVAEPITDADLYPLFPHDGVAGIAANNLFPIDMTQFTRLRLAYIDGWLYFDYKDTQGVARTLAYRRADKSWWPDLFPDGVICRASAVGNEDHGMLVGANSEFAVSGGLTDLGVAIGCQVEFVENQGDARRQKLYRDVMIDANQASPLTVSLSFTNGDVTLPPIAVPGVAGRFQYPLSNGLDQTGIYGSNILVLITWNVSTGAQTILNLWDIAFQPGPELSTNWLSGPTTHGAKGFQQVPRLRIARISNAPSTVSVIIDGVLYTYPLPSSGGKYAKDEIVLQSVKGKTFQWGIAGPAFQLFDQDCEVLLQPWAQPGGYQIVKPF